MSSSPDDPEFDDPIASQYIEEATFLWLQRAAAVNAPHYSPQQFSDLDERLEAQIDGLRVAGSGGWALAQAAVEAGGAEDVFPAAVLAMEAGDGRVGEILERVESAPGSLPGIISAVGWVEPKHLDGTAAAWLAASSTLQQTLGIAACSVHRKDPGAALGRYLASPRPSVRARALRLAGEVGRVDLMAQLLEALKDSKREARFWACQSAVLLGNRTSALDELAAAALLGSPRQPHALTVALQAMDLDRGHALLQQLADTPDGIRKRIIGSGIVGAVRYVPWLIDQMADRTLARVAGEALVGITGADVNADQLETLPPDDFEDGPTDDPADEDVDLPEDVALPWLDVPRVKEWWLRNRGRYQPAVRYFLGAPLAAETCVRVLQAGFQRQRRMAARFLVLSTPGAVLFNTAAPAWRQQRLLAQTRPQK